MQNTGLTDEVRLIAERIREMREIIGFSVEEMAEKTNLTAETYSLYESGKIDLPFTFIHKCAPVFFGGARGLCFDYRRCVLPVLQGAYGGNQKAGDARACGKNRCCP